MEAIKIKAVINFAKPYRVAEGGTTNEGITINYLMTDTLKPYMDDITQTYGYKSTKSSLPLAEWDKLSSVPGLYELDCEIGVNSQNQPQLKPVAVKFLKNVDFVFTDPAASGEKSVPDKEDRQSKSKGGA